MATATMTSKGQITVPKSVREALGVGAGDRLDFVRLDDGTFAMVPATVPLRSLKGLLASKREPVSLEAMDAAIRSGAGVA